MCTDEPIFEIPLDEIEFGTTAPENEWFDEDQIVYRDLVFTLSLHPHKYYRPFVQIGWDRILCHRHWTFCRAARDARLRLIWCDVDDEAEAESRGFPRAHFGEDPPWIRWFFFFNGGPVSLPQHSCFVRTISHSKAGCIEVIAPTQAWDDFKSLRSALRSHTQLRSIDGIRWDQAYALPHV